MPSAQAIRDPYQSGRKIQGLSIVKITPDPQNPLWVTVEGTFDHSRWVLLFDDEKIEVKSDKTFKIRAPNTLKGTSVRFIAIGPLGEIENLDLDLEAVKQKQKPLPSASIRKWSFSLGTAYSLLSYNNPGFTHQEETALTAKLGISYNLTDYFDLGFAGFYTFYPLSADIDPEARFLGLNLRLGYRLPIRSSRWQYKIMAGYYYLTMIVEGNAYGYLNIGGPQIFPVVRYEFPGGTFVSTYFKFSPVAPNFVFLSLDSREIAAGTTVSFPLAAGLRWFLTVDWSDVQLQIDNLAVSSGSLSFGAGIGF